MPFLRTRSVARQFVAATAFTVVELLVVIAIIAILIAILIPTLGRVRAHSRFVQCKANLRSLLDAHANYSVDHNDIKPPLFRVGSTGNVSYDYVSPDIKWNYMPVGQGILVQLKYVPLDILLDPSEGMLEDVQRDRQGWANSANSGSSYAYFWRFPSGNTAMLPIDLGTAKYVDVASRQKAIIMDLNAETGHKYIGHYSGRAWVSHSILKRMNVAYTDGSVRDFRIDEVQLKFPAGWADEIRWFDLASSKIR